MHTTFAPTSSRAVAFAKAYRAEQAHRTGKLRCGPAAPAVGCTRRGAAGPVAFHV